MTSASKKKRVFIVHGWDGAPTRDWYPWLKTELERKGFVVRVPNMPEPESPAINRWVAKLRDVVGEPDKNTFLIGHSIGAQTILRYLETLPADKIIGGAVFVAGWFSLTPQATPTKKEKNIAKPWVHTALNMEAIRLHANRFTTILSDNDPYVSLDDNTKKWKELGATIIIEHNKGHYNEDSGTCEVPAVLSAILKKAYEKQHV